MGESGILFLYFQRNMEFAPEKKNRATDIKSVRKLTVEKWRRKERFLKSAEWKKKKGARKKENSKKKRKKVIM